MGVQFGGLLALAVAAFVAPLAARTIPRRLVPPVVLEVLAGIAIGPQGLDLVQPTDGVYVLLFSAQPEPTWAQVAYVAALGAAAIVGAIVLRRMWRSAWLRRQLLATDQTTSQLRVRGAFVVLLTFAAIAHEFGVDALLGAFVGGVVLNIADSDDRPTRTRYQGKLHAIGYGFLVAVFFIATGVQFDVRSLFASTTSLALVPALLGGILVVRAAPALIYRRKLGARPAVAAGFLQATTLTFPVVVAEVGTGLGLLTSATSAALVGAALLSVLICPSAALALRPWSPASGVEAEADSV